jgi:diguanylate cyclase
MFFLNKQNETTLDFMNALCTVLSECYDHGILVCDASYQKSDVNDELCYLTGYTKTELRQCNPLSLFQEEVSSLFKREDAHISTSIKSKSGILIPVMLYPKRVQIHQKVIFLVMIQKMGQMPLSLADDFSDQFSNRLSHLSSKICQTIHDSHKTSCYSALLLLDIDNFKTVNHSKGHAVGNQVLCEIYKRLSDIMSPLHVSYLQGDEFAIVLSTTLATYAEAEEIITALSYKILETIQEPIYIDHHSFRLTASIGIVVFLGKEYAHDKMVQYVDSALYEAKKSGRNTIHFFNPLLQQKLEEHAVMLERLHYAIYHHQMSLFYQKQWARNPHTNEVYEIGAEALIRWIDPVHGTITPDKFIPLSEESGLIIPLGAWILKEAFKQLKSWQDDPKKCHWQLSINISIKQFEKDDFIPIVQELLQSLQCDATKIRFELTESLLINDLKSSLRKIYALTKLGISFSIDDFGTGYSSLSYLKRLPIHELKIDKSFIRDLASDHADVILVQTILGIAQQFGLDVVAEGVETQEQYKILCDMGCRYFQGYFLSKPTQSSLL